MIPYKSKVFLFPEPQNKFDSDAIIVKDENNNKLGYVNNEVLPYVYKIFDRIYNIYVSRVSDDEIPYVWIKMEYEGECLDEI